MRRAPVLLTLTLAIMAVPLVFPAQASPAVQVTLPGTNTPVPTQFLFDIATNTPAGPSPTPTATPTATSTPTATPTSTPTPTITPSPTDTPTPTPTPNGPFFYPEGVNPLTGQPYPSDEAMNRRNLIVKISNYPPVVRPQHGVNQADVVYEVEAEGGVTRFAAIYRNNAPTHVGSIRSARLVDLELIVMYNALLAYSGTSDPIQQMILSADFVYQTFSPLKGDNCEAGFCRFPEAGKAFEHTLFLDTTKVWDLATRRNVNTPLRARGFAFSDIPDPNGLPANDVFIDWYGQTDARWQYDPATGRYLRYTDSLPHFDAADGQQLWADNLIIIQVPHERRPDLFERGARNESLEIQLWDQGPAVLVRDGRWYSGFWRRRDREPGSALQILYGNERPMMMKPGRTWVSVVRGFGDVIISETQPNMAATATTIFLSATPTFTVTPGPSPTPNTSLND